MLESVFDRRHVERWQFQMPDRRNEQDEGRDCKDKAAAVAEIPKNAVQMRGEPRYYKVVGKAGKAIERGFCPTCGSQVTVKLERLPDVLGLQAANLDDPSIYQPMMDIKRATLGSHESQHPKAYPRPAIVIAISTPCNPAPAAR